MNLSVSNQKLYNVSNFESTNILIFSVNFYPGSKTYIFWKSLPEQDHEQLYPNKLHI